MLRMGSMRALVMALHTKSVVQTLRLGCRFNTLELQSPFLRGSISGVKRFQVTGSPIFVLRFYGAG